MNNSSRINAIALVFFNLGDSVIIIAAVLLGRKSGFLAGAIGSSVADIAMGYQHFAPVTFVVKGFVLSKRFKEKYHVTGSIVMVLGYFFLMRPWGLRRL